MKDGEVVGTLPVAETSPDRLVAMMVGRAVELAYPERAATTQGLLLSVESAAAGVDRPAIRLTVRRGEILGLAGVQGAGLQDTARALFGIGGTALAMTLDGQPYRPASPAEAIAAGVVYVPADRHAESLFLPHAIRPNVSLPEIARFAGTGLIDRGREAAAVSGETKRLAVKAASLEQPVATLSGGNQQKVVLAKEILGNPRLLLLDEPTRGVDVGAKGEIYARLRALAAQGLGILVASSEMPELIGLCDRIVVLRQGRNVAEFIGGVDEHTVLAAANGREA